jgi:hypothetical protein
MINEEFTLQEYQNFALKIGNIINDIHNLKVRSYRRYLSSVIERHITYFLPEIRDYIKNLEELKIRKGWY